MPVWANPAGEQVISGGVTFERGLDGSLTISQGSDKAIIHWQDFSIGAGELTKFVQPSSMSAVLNRVIGGLPSSIHGTLQANGRVLLINPNGILVGPTGRIDVGGFLASTLDVSDSEFLGGGDMIFRGSSTASVVNQGTINAIGGDIFLFAQTVQNSGTLNAPQGTVGLAAGTEILLAQAGDERVFVRAGGNASVTNSGTVTAATAELKAHGNLYALAVNNTGVIRATSAAKKGGRVFLMATGGGTVRNSGTISARGSDGAGGEIKLDAGPTGKVENSGTLDAEAVVTPETPAVMDGSAANGATATGEGTDPQAQAKAAAGGQIVVMAGQIDLLEGSMLRANGLGQGGTILVGGGFQGSDPKVINATKVNVAPAVTLQADGGTGGGRVVVWSDGETAFAGKISARATGAEGQGGFAEVSGKQTLDYRGVADLRGAGSGSTGTLLLDPTDFTVGASEAATIVANLVSSNVMVSTSGSGVQAGNLTVSSRVTYTSANSLTLLAHGNISFLSSVQNGGTGAVRAVAGWDGSTGFSGGPGIVNGTALFNTIVSAGAYGLNDGSIQVGASSGTLAAVSVGSRFGATNAAGYAMTLRGSDTMMNASAQVGYTEPLAASSFNISGPIGVWLKDSLSVTAGSQRGTFAQVGQGGLDATLQSLQPANDFAGDITVVALNAISLQAGTGSVSYAQIGNGGHGNLGNHSGDVSLTTGNLTIKASPSALDWAMVGHGGYGSDGNHSGNITINAQNVTLEGGMGATNNDYAQIGHGGSLSDGNLSGAIVMNISGNLSLTGGSSRSAIAFIGHGAAGDTLGGGTRQGNIDIRVGGETTLVDGTVSTAPWFIGHHSATVSASSNAQIYFSTGTLDYSNGSAATMTTLDLDFALRFGEALAGGAVTVVSTGTGGLNVSGAWNYSSANALTLLSTRNVMFNAGVQNSGTGALNLAAGWDNATGRTAVPGTGTLMNFAAIQSLSSSYGNLNGSVIIGSGTQSTSIAVGNKSGSTNVAAYGLTVQASATNAAGNAQLGYRNAAGGTGAFTFALSSYFHALNRGTVATTQVGHGLTTSAGGVVISSDLVFTQPFAFGALAARDVKVLKGGVQNSAAGSGGAVTLVGGWDKSSGVLANQPVDFASIAATSTAYGNSQGSVYIGDGTQTTAVAVGSASGSTNVAGDGLLVQAGTTNANGYAVLGYQGSANGAIDLRLRSYFQAINKGTVSTTQLGHGTPVNFAGSVTTTTAFTFGQPFSFAALARGDVLFFKSVQNSSGSGAGTGGVVTAVGGWDGVTGMSGSTAIVDGTSLFNTIVGAGAYGLNVGGIQIGATDSSTGASVGSRYGATNIAGNGLSILGSDATASAAAQLGFRAATTGLHANAPISVQLKGDLIVEGGIQFATNARIGHTGSTGNSFQGNITIKALGDLLLQGGAAGGAAANAGGAVIGHGGNGAVGNHSGSITIEGGGAFSLLGGSANSTAALVGHGGGNATGDHSGDISITIPGALTLAAGAGNTSFAQIGNDAVFATSNLSGNITIHAGDVSLSGAGSQAFAQIGHGGISSNGSQSGALSIIATGNLTLVGSSANLTSTAHIGHGFGSTTGTRQGNVDIRVAGESNLVKQSSPWQIGHVTTTGGGITAAAVLFSTGTLDYTTASVSPDTIFNADFATQFVANLQGGAVTVSSTGPFSAIYVMNPWTYSSANDVTIVSRYHLYFYAGLQNSGTGNVNLVGGWDGTTGSDGSSAAVNFAAILASPASYGANPHSSSIWMGTDVSTVPVAVGSRLGKTTVVSRDVVLRGGNTLDAAAQIGYRVTGTKDATGAIDIRARQTLNMGAGSASGAYVQVGHGSTLASGSWSGTISVQAGGGIVAFPGSGEGAYVQIGHGGLYSSGTRSGSITISTSSIGGGSGGGHGVYFQIGHGGRLSSSYATGDITITASGSLSFSAGNGFGSYAQIGHGGHGASGTHTGNISVTTPGSLTLTRGQVGGWVQIGNGGGTIDGTASGNINVSAGDVSLGGLGGFTGSYAQIGNGGSGRDGNHSGDITVSAASLTLSGGSADGSYAQIGNGGSGADGAITGNILVTTTGNLTIQAGSSGIQSYSQIGHGGPSTSGSRMGSLTVGVGGSLQIAGSSAGTSAWGRLGHSSINGAVGAIDLRVTGQTTLVNGVPSSSPWQIGHVNPASGSELFFSTGTLRYSTSATATDVSLTSDFAGKFVANLQGGAVTIASTGAGAMNVNAAFAYNSANALTFLSARNITFSAGVQNASSGAVNIAAGWDGATGRPASPDTSPLLNFAAIQALSASYGNNQGRVNIGNGTQTAAVAVGSALGGTSVAAYGLTVQASTTTAAGIAQLGYRDAAGGTGALNVALRTYFNALNRGTVSTTQIGHGAAVAAGNVMVTSSLSFDQPFTFAALATRDVVFLDSVQNNAGNGGNFNLAGGWNGTAGLSVSDGSVAFDLVTSSLAAYGNNSGSVVLGSPSGTRGVAVGSRTGRTTVTAYQLVLQGNTGGAPDQRYAQLGYHIDGVAVVSAATGAIGVITKDKVVMTSGAAAFSDVQIGHGGRDFSTGLAPNISLGGGIGITGGLDARAGIDGSDSTARVGHGGVGASGNRDGFVSVVRLSSSITLSGNATIGHGGAGSTGDSSGDITASAKNVTLDAVAGIYGAQIGHGGANATGDSSGNIVVGGDHGKLMVASGSVQGYSQIGHGGTNRDGTQTGQIVLSNFNDVTITGGSASGAYAQVGHGGIGADGTQSGVIVATIGQDLTINGGNGSNAYAQIGHGAAAFAGSGTRQGDVNVTVWRDTSLVNGSASSPWYIGHVTSTTAGVSASDVDFDTGTLDYSAASTSAAGLLDSDFAARFSRNLAGGDVLIMIHGPNNWDGHLINQGAWNYDSGFMLKLTSYRDLTISGDIINRGIGSIEIVNDAMNDSRPWANFDSSFRNTATVSSGGAVRVFAASPQTSTLGSLASLPRHYNTWYDEAGMESGVYFKFAPTLILSAQNQSRLYGQANLPLAFTITGLQPGDTLASIFGMIPSPASMAGAGSHVGTYGITWPGGLTPLMGYGVIFRDAILTINPAPLKLTAKSALRIAGTDFIFSGTEFTAAGLQNGENIGLVSLFSLGAFADATSKGSPYPIFISDPSGGSADRSNYSVTFQPGKMFVLPNLGAVQAMSGIIPEALNFNFNGGVLFLDMANSNSEGAEYEGGNPPGGGDGSLLHQNSSGVIGGEKKNEQEKKEQGNGEPPET